MASEELARKLPRRFAEGFWANEVCGRLGVRRSSGLAEVKATELPRLAALLKAWELKLTGTEGYLKAEVTCGGVSTKELSAAGLRASASFSEPFRSSGGDHGVEEVSGALLCG